LPVDVDREEHGKVVVLSMGDNTVGMVADRTREILRVAPSLIDPAPALLTRGTGDAEITSICRLEQGRRLVAVLSPDRLFRSELVKRVLADHEDRDDSLESQTNGDAMADEQFVIFRLGDQEYGLPIHAVDAALWFRSSICGVGSRLRQSHRRAHSAYSSSPSAAAKPVSWSTLFRKS
jgi:purine-binding chemotaxis protein CheW